MRPKAIEKKWIETKRESKSGLESEESEMSKTFQSVFSFSKPWLCRFTLSLRSKHM